MLIPSRMMRFVGEAWPAFGVENWSSAVNLARGSNKKMIVIPANAGTQKFEREGKERLVARVSRMESGTPGLILRLDASGFPLSRE
jgi:hypothetical protein